MFDSSFIENVVKKLSEAVPPGLQTVKQDLERNFRSVLQSAFAKLDLVTREEFDVQKGVLTKTRAKIDALEKQIAHLEAQLLDKQGGKQTK